VYGVLFILLCAVNVVWVYRDAIARVPNNPAYAFGVTQGGVMFPLIVIAGIAACWPQNRGFRGVVRVLFWASLIMVCMKLQKLAANHLRPGNSLKPTPGNTTWLSPGDKTCYAINPVWHRPVC
jgi:hypothetical protein